MGDNFLSDAERQAQPILQQQREQQEYQEWWRKNGQKATKEFIDSALKAVTEVFDTVGYTWYSRSPYVERKNGLMGFLFGSTYRDGNWYEIEVEDVYEGDYNYGHKYVYKNVYLYLWGDQSGIDRSKRGGPRRETGDDEQDGPSFQVNIRYKSFQTPQPYYTKEDGMFFTFSSIEELKNYIAGQWAANKIPGARVYRLPKRRPAWE